DVLSMALAVKNKRRSRDKLRRLKVALDSHRGGGDRQPLGD
ncbi:TPA: transcriptional regulator, partial [Vibrio vulnificus]|nr:transcriptional regulator [Vibrio vulnificus]